MIVNANGEANFPHKLLSTNRHVANCRKDFAENSSINKKLRKTQLSKKYNQADFLANFLGH